MQDCDISAHCSAELGLYESRGYPVDPYVTLSQLSGQNLGQTQQGGLAHTVGAESLQKYTLLFILLHIWK